MSNYLKTLLEYFVDGTELDSLQVQLLLDNGLIHQVQYSPILVGYKLTEFGKQQLLKKKLNDLSKRTTNKSSRMAFHKQTERE